MLPRSCRLSSVQLNEVIKKGKVMHSPFFWIRFVENGDQTKVAVISPSKIVKTAVKRNLIRRKVYSAISSFFDNVANGYHIVLCVKEPILKAEPSVIFEQTRSIFVKSGLLK